MNDSKLIRPELHKLATQWLVYAEANGVPAKGKTRERIAHAWAASAYIAGILSDAQMFVLNVRGYSELELWATGTPDPDADTGLINERLSIALALDAAAYEAEKRGHFATARTEYRRAAKWWRLGDAEENARNSDANAARLKDKEDETAPESAS